MLLVLMNRGKKKFRSDQEGYWLFTEPIKEVWYYNPRSSDPFYIVNYYIKWVTISWTDGMKKVEIINIENKCEQ